MFPYSLNQVFENVEQLNSGKCQRSSELKSFDFTRPTLV